MQDPDIAWDTIGISPFRLRYLCLMCSTALLFATISLTSSLLFGGGVPFWMYVRVLSVYLFLANIRRRWVPYWVSSRIMLLIYIWWALGRLFGYNAGKFPLFIAYFETSFPAFPMSSLYVFGGKMSMLNSGLLIIVLGYCLIQSVGIYTIEISITEHVHFYMTALLAQIQPAIYFFMVHQESVKCQKILLKILRSAEEKSLAKTFFISRMSHELRTPLQGMLSSANLLKQTAINEEQAMYLSTIDSCGHLLLDVVVKILDITRIESGRFDSVKERFSVPDLVQKVLDSVASMADSKNLSLYSQCDPHPEGYDVEGDQAHFAEIVTNVRRPFHFLFPWAHLIHCLCLFCVLFFCFVFFCFVFFLFFVFSSKNKSWSETPSSSPNRGP